MNQLTRAAGILIAASLVIAPSAPAQATKGVEVINTTANPVPTVVQGTTSITGNVTVANTPNVNINNTPNVNVVSMPPLEIGNTDGSSIPVHNSVAHQTVSFTITMNASQTFANSFPRLPDCSGGQEFLIDSVFAAPDPIVGADVKALTGWAVRIGTVHEFPGGGKTADPIIVYGNGPQHASAQLGAGEVTFASSSGGTLEAIVSTLGVPVSGTYNFRVHVSGYC